MNRIDAPMTMVLPTRRRGPGPIARLRAQLLHRRALRELADLPPHLLKDIGLVDQVRRPPAEIPLGSPYW